MGEVEDGKAILFRYGDLGVGKYVYYIRKCGLFSRGKERGPVLTGRDESPTVYIVLELISWRERLRHPSLHATTINQDTSSHTYIQNEKNSASHVKNK